jgi:outer membrane protein
MKHPIALAAFALSSLLSVSAQAQSAGTWSARIGATHIAPDVTSGNLSAPSPAGAKTDVRAASQLSGGLTYMYTDHFAVDLPLALPFRHDLVADGSLKGVGKVGDVKSLPLTVIAQYRFGEAQAALRPYVGLGVTYAHFYGERGTATLTGLTNPGGSATQLSVDSRWGTTAQVGVVAQLDNAWFLDASVAKTFIKTRNTLSTGQFLDIQLDPTTVMLGVGKRF